MNINKELVARSIRNYRDSHNLTQSQLAAKLGIDQRQIRRWEKAQTLPNHLCTRVLVEMKIIPAFND